MTVGSRSGSGIGHVGDDAWQAPLERIWLSVLRFGGDGVLVESFEGAGKTSGGGAATCWCGSGRWVSTSSSIRCLFLRHIRRWDGGIVNEGVGLVGVVWS